MKIKRGLKMRSIAGESIVMLHSREDNSTSKLISFNPTSVYLWESLQGKDFSTGDVCSLLLEKYEVGEEQAGKDAAAWVDRLLEAGVLEQ